MFNQQCLHIKHNKISKFVAMAAEFVSDFGS